MKLHHLKSLKQSIFNSMGRLKWVFIFPLLLLPFMAVVQGQTTEPIKKEVKSYKNQFTFGAEIFATNISYTRKITKNIRIGVGLGLGLGVGFPSSIYTLENHAKYNLQDGIIEIGHIDLVINFKLNRYLYYEFKPQLVTVTKGDLGQTFQVNGFKNGLFIRVKRIKIGLNVTVGQTEDGDWLYYIKPLKIKIPIQW